MSVEEKLHVIRWSMKCYASSKMSRIGSRFFKEGFGAQHKADTFLGGCCEHYCAVAVGAFVNRI